MKDQLNTLNTYFWNVGNDIADIRLLAEGALALYEGDAEPLHRLGMKNNEEVAASAFDTIGTALYDLREKIAAMQQSHLAETIRQSEERIDESLQRRPAEQVCRAFSVCQASLCRICRILSSCVDKVDIRYCVDTVIKAGEEPRQRKSIRAQLAALQPRNGDAHHQHKQGLITSR